MTALAALRLLCAVDGRDRKPAQFSTSSPTRISLSVKKEEAEGEGKPPDAQPQRFQARLQARPVKALDEPGTEQEEKNPTVTVRMVPPMREKNAGLFPNKKKTKQKNGGFENKNSEMEESSEDLEDLDVICSLYISPMTDPEPFIKTGEEEHSGNVEQNLTTKQLQGLLKSYQLIGKWNILKTSCGFLISFTNELDADKVVSNNLAAVFGPMQIVRLHGRRSFLRQAVFLREVPWAIQLNDLKEALVRQGITSARVERKRHHVRVEVCEPEHYETLLRRGLNFFGAIRFQAIPDRGIRSHHSWHDPSSTLSSDPNFVLQCYRCQGFWHIAANCRHEVRCVRCGDHHSVQFCPRPRSDPVCCHCSGPHHAAYRFCPVRLDLVNAVPVSLTLTTRRAPNRYLPYPRN